MERFCPGCAEPLQKAQCPRCGGLWLSGLQELEKLDITDELLQPRELPMSRHHPGDAPRPCPSCRQRWLIQRDTGLYPIEVCPYCEGVWVERVVLIKRRYD